MNALSKLEKMGILDQLDLLESIVKKLITIIDHYKKLTAPKAFNKPSLIIVI